MESTIRPVLRDTTNSTQRLAPQIKSTTYGGGGARKCRRWVWRFKAREADRRHVEDSIRQGRHDVDCSTERKGSPHVLVCTKNQASYERRVAQRRADLDDLTRLKA